MAVVKSSARLLDAAGGILGEGRAYLHLREPEHLVQPATGTLSLDWWEVEGLAPVTLELGDGQRLTIEADADRLSGCVVGRILRYRTSWPGAATSSS